MKARIAIIAVLLPLIITKLIQPNEAQEMPLEYQQVLKTVAKTGDYKSNVLKVNIPRNDIHVTIDRKSTRLNSSHSGESRMPSSA